MNTRGAMNLERIVRFYSGYDCIHFECKFNSPICKPNSGGSHGVHGLNITFFVKGDEGAVQFNLYTGWLPQRCSVDPCTRSFGDIDWNQHNLRILPSDLGYHSKTPRYDGHKPISESCQWTDDQPCYYDGSGLNAMDAMYTLVNGGDDELWKFLEGFYAFIFRDGKYPDVYEYPCQSR